MYHFFFFGVAGAMGSFPDSPMIPYPAVEDDDDDPNPNVEDDGDDEGSAGREEK